MEGTVKWFNRTKGYGFVAGDDGKEYFVHHSAIKEGNFIRENDKVSFEPVETEKGLQAQQVVLLQKGSEIASGEQKSKEVPEEPQSEEPQSEEPQEPLE